MKDHDRLIDEADISRLLARYCELVDRRDGDAVANEIFTADGRTDHGIFGSAAVGRTEIAEMYARSNRTTESSAHYISNSIIDIDGDSAKVRSYVSSWTWLRSSAHSGKIRPADFIITGIFVDLMRRDANGWRIFDRKLEPLGAGALGVGQLPDAYRGVSGEPS